MQTNYFLSIRDTMDALLPNDGHHTAFGVYNFFSAILLAAFPGAPASCIDPDTYSFFSDCYKEENGFRPSGDWTVSAIEAWIGAAADRQDAADEAAEAAEEAEWERYRVA